jgi:Cellulase (glycosyl hydrolase family 5)
MLSTGIFVGTLTIPGVAQPKAEPAAAPPAAAGGPAFVVGRAINVAAGWNRVRYSLPKDTGPVLDPPYIRNQDWTDEEKPEDFAYIKQLGFNSVRFMVEPTPFVQFSGTRLDALYVELKATVQQMLGAGLKVIIDLHTIYPDRLGFVNSGEQTAEYLNYRSMVQRVAGLAAMFDPSTVALELQNEPRNFSCAPGTGWNKYQPDLLAAARAAAANTTIILTGGCAGGIEGLLNVEAAQLADPNTLFSFHYYNSLLFTHQGADWTGFEYFVREVRYPSTNNGSFDSIWLPTKARIEVAPLSAETKARLLKEGEDWLRFHLWKGFTRSTIDADLRRVSEWAQRNNVAANRIFMGEFGVIRPKRTDVAGTWRPYADDRAQWHRDVRELAEQSGFSWAAFSYMGNFGIMASNDLRIGTPRFADPALVSALGLSGPSPTTTTTVMATTTTLASTTTTTTVPATTTTTTVPATTTTATTVPGTTVPGTTVAIRPVLDGRRVRLISTCDKTKAIDIKGWNKNPGAVAQLYWTNDQANQRFTFRGISLDRYQLIGDDSGLPIGAAADQAGSAIVLRPASDSGDVWKIVGRPSGIAEFRLASNENFTLDVTGPGTINASPLQLSPVAPEACGQKFKLVWLN